jgi:hypothetical protein
VSAAIVTERPLASLEEARQQILAGVMPKAVEVVDLPAALGRVLAESVVARLTLPPWDNSAMDGFAVRAADVAGASPFGDQAGSINPYASPASAGMLPHYFALMPISPRAVAADTVFNYAWQIWKSNLGLLVGITVIQIAANYVIAIPFGAAQAVFEQQKEKEMGIAVSALGQIITNLVQMYLNIGIAQIALKLARRQPAGFADLFGGLPRMLPLIGAWLIAVIPLLVGFLLLIVPGVALGLTGVRLRAYALGSLLGQLPLTIAYADLGAAGGRALLGGADWQRAALWPTVLGLTALALSLAFPLVMRRWRQPEPTVRRGLVVGRLGVGDRHRAACVDFDGQAAARSGQEMSEAPASHPRRDTV